jgi:phi13 family phage major tail protein
MTINSDEYRTRIGLDSLYVAEVTQDDASGYTAGTPAFLAPAAEATQAPTTNSETVYADDQPFENIISEGETKLELTITALVAAMYASLLGRVMDVASGRVFDNPAASPPYFALSFRSIKSNGKYRYYQYLKGTFEPPAEDLATKTATPAPKTTKLVFTAIPTVYKFDLGTVTDAVKRIFGDEDTTNFDATGWFSQVQTPSAVAPSALALSSSVPTDGATGISVSADQTLTFNNALPDTNGISLIKSSDGSIVAGTITLDSTKKIVTINPTSNLTASSDYIIAYNVVDIYGQSLKGAVNFTTA